jgi:hypothetical protein
MYDYVGTTHMNAREIDIYRNSDGEYFLYGDHEEDAGSEILLATATAGAAMRARDRLEKLEKERLIACGTIVRRCTGRLPRYEYAPVYEETCTEKEGRGYGHDGHVYQFRSQFVPCEMLGNKHARISKVTVTLLPSWIDARGQRIYTTELL